ncbi:MAG: hypothetical protein KDD09_27235, partial [Phaeodactylibacter sp.]|nr:hypothetical protein [Phaeodactylibacter sp.]
MKKLIFLLFAFSALHLAAQDMPSEPDTTRLWQVVTVDGNQYYGKILSRDGETIQLKTETVGVISIPVRN